MKPRPGDVAIFTNKSYLEISELLEYGKGYKIAKVYTKNGFAYVNIWSGGKVRSGWDLARFTIKRTGIKGVIKLCDTIL